MDSDGKKPTRSAPSPRDQYWQTLRDAAANDLFFFAEQIGVPKPWWARQAAAAIVLLRHANGTWAMPARLSDGSIVDPGDDREEG